jgi:hypothetical protein
MSEPLGAAWTVVAEKGLKERRNWRPLVDQMSNVQVWVHLSLRYGIDDEEDRAKLLFSQSRRDYESAIREEVKGLGCMDPGRVILQEGTELKELSDRAKWAASSIANTYNYDLAQAILQVGRDAPRANRNVYYYRLSQWEQARAERKEPQINKTETAWAMNRAKEAFHKYNAILARAEVWPYPTVCPVCAEYVAANPYSSMDELYRRCELPAHVGCPHHGRPLLDRKLTREECAGLWTGG